MEVKKIHFKGKGYLVHWSSQRDLGKGMIITTVVFKDNEKICKARIVEHRLNGDLAYDVHLFRERKIVTISSREITETPLAIAPREKFVPAQRSIDQGQAAGDNGLVLRSPLAGLVVKIKVTVGQWVEKNQQLVVIESMKMENEISAPFAAFIKTLSISEGNLVKPNQVIVTFEMKGGGCYASTEGVDKQKASECGGSS